MEALVKIKKICAVILIVGFFLPLSQCTGQFTMAEVDSTRNTKSAQSSEIGKPNNEKEFYVPYKTFKLNSYYSWLSIVVYFFAIPFLMVGSKIVNKPKKVVFRLGELLVSCFAAYSIIMSTRIFYTPTIAGHFVLAAIYGYILISLAQLIQDLVDAYRKYKSKNV